jgi:hypothetical protein
MALATYTDLLTAIQTWMARVGDVEISGNQDDILDLAESRLNRVLPLNAMRTDVNLTATSGSRFVALPSDFYEPVSLKLTTFGIETTLKPRVAGTYNRGVYAGVPKTWAINGTNIELDVIANQAHTLILRYRQKFALSASAPTNWLLTNYPDAYLQACLIEAELLAKDFQSASARNQLFTTQTVVEIADMDSKLTSVGTLSVDIGIGVQEPFNILNGT